MKRENLTLIIHILITLMSSSAQLENAKLAHKVSLEIKRLNAYSNTNTKLALRARTQVPPRRRRRKKMKGKVVLSAQKSLNNAKRYYGRVGNKIRRGVMDMQRDDGRSKARGLMEEYFHLQHRLTAAAIKIQRFRRYFVERRRRIRLARSTDASIVIQKYIRGVLTRTRLARWWARRIYLICTYWMC